MSHFQVRDLFPRPAREIVFGMSDIKKLSQSIGKNQTADSFMESEIGKRVVDEAKLMIRGALQTALFASGCYAVRYLGWSSVTTVILGSVLSTASMVIGASFYGLSFGARSLLYCIGTGSFWQFASGMASIGLSYYALERLEIFQIGFLERLVKLAAEQGAPALIRHML